MAIAFVTSAKLPQWTVGHEPISDKWSVNGYAGNPDDTDKPYSASHSYITFHCNSLDHALQLARLMNEAKSEVI